MSISDFGAELGGVVRTSLKPEVRSLRPFREAASVAKEKATREPGEALKGFMFGYLVDYINVVAINDEGAKRRAEMELGVKSADRFTEVMGAIPREMREVTLENVFFGVKRSSELKSQLGKERIDKILEQWQGWMGELKAQELLEDLGWQVIRHPDMDKAGADLIGVRPTADGEAEMVVFQVKPGTELQIVELDSELEVEEVNGKKLRPRSMGIAAKKLMASTLAEVYIGEVSLAFLGIPVESAQGGIESKNSWFFKLSNGELLGFSEEFKEEEAARGIVMEFGKKVNKLFRKDGRA